MLLNEIADITTQPSTKHIYRAFGVPLRKVWESDQLDFHERDRQGGYNGTWISLKPDSTSSMEYGKDLGTTPTLMLPLYCTYELDASLAARDPINHEDDDHEQPGETMKVGNADLGELVEVKAFVNHEWIPLDKNQLMQTLTSDPSALDSILQCQEIEVEDCPNPEECVSQETSISSIDDLQGLCEGCVASFGLSNIFSKLGL